MASRKGGAAGIGQYLKEAFLFRWNLLAFVGGTAAAALTPMADVLLPLIGAVEMAYLAGLISIPRFRAAIDAKYGGKSDEKSKAGESEPLQRLVLNLSPDARRRFERLRDRCLRMRAIARGVRGRSGGGSSVAEDVSSPALDRMLWVFLRLLHSQDSLAHFLRATHEDELRLRVDQLRKQLAQEGEDDDHRISRSLNDSLATAEQRLENYARAEQNARFVSIELDRIEQKIQALSEAAVNRQDPDFISSQVDSAAESMLQTEKAIIDLQAITGMVEDLEEPPAILEADLRGVVQR